jgi:hypothetical protein
MTTKEFKNITFMDDDPGGDGKYTCSKEPNEDGTYACHYCNYWNSLSNKIFWIALTVSLVMGIGDVIIELFV